MSHMTKKNLQNIQEIFQEKTGVDLCEAKKVPAFPPVKKLAVLAAVLACCFALVGFTFPLFSPLDEDELSLLGNYEGNGIVSVYVENDSDKDLKFQEQTKLMRWIVSEEVERLDGEIRFENTEFPAHSSGTMYIDLSKAYDMEALEKEGNNPETYYLLLTNNNFLFGHDWICSVSFREKKPTEPEETEPQSNSPAENLVEIREELRFYFEESYGGAPVSLNEANFTYQQKVEEVLTRFSGTVVPSQSPYIMVGGPSTLLEPEPMLGKIPEGVIFDNSIPKEQQYLLSLDEWHFTDAYGRMVAGFGEKAWVQMAMIPQREGQTDGGVAIPLVFWLVYDAEEAADWENHAFVYGRILSFEEMEQYKVRQDEHYAIYDVTNLIYTDVDAYLDYFLSGYETVYCDAQVRQRVQAIYDYYRNADNFNALYGYRMFQEMDDEK